MLNKAVVMVMAFKKYVGVVCFLTKTYRRHLDIIVPLFSALSLLYLFLKKNYHQVFFCFFLFIL